MKVVDINDIRPAVGKTMEDLRKLFEINPLTGKPIPLFPMFPREKLVAQMKKIHMKKKPYDMEDADWLLYFEESSS